MSFERICKSLIKCIFLPTNWISTNAIWQTAEKIAATRPEGSSVSKSEQKDGLVNGFWSISGNFLE
jgi:hypothetical protein